MIRTCYPEACSEKIRIPAIKCCRAQENRRWQEWAAFLFQKPARLSITLDSGMVEFATATRFESCRCSYLSQGFKTAVDVVKSATRRMKMKETKDADLMGKRLFCSNDWTLHIRNNRVGKLGTGQQRGILHHVRKVAGNRLVLYRLINRINNEVGRFRPGEITQQHFAGKNQ